MKTTIKKLIALTLFITAHSLIAQNINNKLDVISFSSFKKNATVDTGYWSIETRDDKYCLIISNSKNGANASYRIRSCYDASEFITQDGSQTFELKRATGTLVLNGDITQKNAEGTFTFTRATSFENFLAEEGIALDDELYYFKLFLGDIDTSYISEITALGYEPTIRELGKLIWHDASISYIQSIASLFDNTITLTEISKFATKNISVAYIEKARAKGYNYTDPYKYIQLKKHNNLKNQ